MDKQNTILKRFISLLLIKPQITAGIIALIVSILAKLVANLTGFQFFIAFLFQLIAIEGLVYIVSKSATDRINSIVYMTDRIRRKDLNHTIEVSEFDGLEAVSSSLNSMITDLKSIMRSLKDLSNRLVSSSDLLNQNSGKLNNAIDDIAATTDEIARGASEQASEAEKGVELITNLSDQISNVHNQALIVGESSEHMKSLSSNGVKTLEILKKVSSHTEEVSDEVLGFIYGFTDKINNIGEFVSSINTIAEQTNLLALNAAIEAARAGDAGRGFAVVADEIRILADNSKKATEEIEYLVEDIMIDASTATTVVKALDNVVDDQSNAVDNTSEIFHQIANSIELIIDQIDQTIEAVDIIEKDKNNAIDAIQNISAVSQESAAASQEVAASTSTQKDFIEEMLSTTKILNRLALEFKQYTDIYKI
ncbi:MAG: hypothetical protein GX974_07190 [Clostridiales bacterium]|nr:hypothetical protein [Clostridiales bacterium]